MLTAFAGISPAIAETNAGSRILNTAAVHFTVDGNDIEVKSNETALIVAERLDVALDRVGNGVVSATGGDLVAPLVLRNAGNGNEAFDLAATIPGAAGRITGIAIDVDGDGRYDATRDTLLVDGRTPMLAPDATLRLLVLATGIPAGANGTIEVTAKAVTGAGDPGTIFAGRGDGGGDALVGPTHAQATVPVPFADGIAAPTLTKSAEVRAPDGSAQIVHGAVITYTLAARFAGPIEGVVIDDPIPAGTTYRTGSLTLDGSPLSDADDADAGRSDAAGIHVALGTIPTAGVRTVRFQVTIQ